MELNLSGQGEQAVTLQQLRDVFVGGSYDNVDFQKLSMQGGKSIFLLSTQIPSGKDAPLVEKRDRPSVAREVAAIHQERRFGAELANCGSANR